MLAVVLKQGDRHEVDPGPVAAPRASPAAAAAALATFVEGVDRRDSSALAGLAPGDDPGAADMLSAIGRNAAALDLRDVSARYVDQAGTVAADGSWTGIVDLTWQVGDLDTAASRADVAVSFVPDGDRLGIAGFVVSAGARTPLWVRGALSVARDDDVLVMVDGSRAEAAAVARRVARGRDVVRRVLPDWDSAVVVEVPASAADLDETLGATPGTYTAIAGVTATPGSVASADAPVHVFVNPDVTAGLRRAGAQVVMSHELVHVATDAVRTPMEPWLLEGFADYVALRDTRLPDRTTLGRAIELVRRDGLPDALPTAADFDTRASDLQARYEQAWLACRVIADRLGENGLVRTHNATAAGRPVERVLGAAGLPVATLARDWRDRLRVIARG